MKNIKKHYWIVILIIVFLATILSTLHIKGCLNESIANMSLSFSAIILSIIGIALSDPQTPNFIGVISAQNIDPNRTEQLINHKYPVKFEVSNLMSESILNFSYKIRYPSVVNFPKDKTNSDPNIIFSNRTRYLTDSSFGVLTGKQTYPENKIIFTLEIPLQKWKDTTGHIYFTITGDNINPSVFVLKNYSKEDLLKRKVVSLEKKV